MFLTFDLQEKLQGRTECRSPFKGIQHVHPGFFEIAYLNVGFGEVVLGRGAIQRVEGNDALELTQCRGVVARLQQQFSKPGVDLLVLGRVVQQAFVGVRRFLAASGLFEPARELLEGFGLPAAEPGLNSRST